MDERKAVVLLRRRERRRSRHKGPGYWVVRLLLALVLLSFVTMVGTGVASVAAAAGVYAYFAQNLPDPQAIEKVQEDFETTKIYDRTGQVLLYEVFDPRPNRGDRTWVELEQIPMDLRNATIAIEDRSFYQNPGINLRGFARAMWSNLRGLPIQGGSSITMQLIKNVLIPPEERYVRSYARKIKEVILALELNRRYPGREGKDQILEWYLNTNFYGNFAYGVEAAAQVYFDKHVWELDLAECAMLAAIPQYPGLNPMDAPEQAKKRQALVLDQMVEQGYITREQAEAAKAKPLKIRESLETRFQAEHAPHFALYVRKLLERDFGHEKVYGGGLRVYTTLDLDRQRMAEQFAREYVKAMQEDTKYDRNVSNAAVVILRPRTGEILAMVGSLDYYNKEI
ncbi:MAG: transglycosylase domain-containing protein, partial [Anaerolineae bacterium]|nr:transglycosylase domain-containing protein [Anaerolineae bacterium]